MAGTWATQLVLMQSKINASLTAVPATNAKIFDNDDSYSDASTAYARNGYGIIPASDSSYAQLAGIVAPGNTKKGGTTQDVGFTGKLMEKITSVIAGIDLEDVKSDTRHPLIIMATVGDRLLTSAMTAIGAAAALSLVGGIKIAGTGIELAPAYIAVFTGFLMPFAGLFGVGGMLAYILPNTPFLLWIGIIVGWTLMVIEAILAAPLWAVMHLHPNGDDLTGRGGNGYMLVLGLLLRPALIIFGLIAAIILSELFGKFINLIFFDVFSSNNLNGTLGFTGILFGTGLYASMMMLIIKNTYALMHMLPDQLMQWAGGGNTHLGNFANQISEGAIQKGVAVGGGVLGQAAGQLGRGAGEIASANRNISQFKQDQAKQALSNQINQQNGYAQKDMTEGTGAGAIDQAIDSQSAQTGQDSLSSMRDKSTASAATKILGGKDSPAVAQYRQGVLEQMNNGASFSQAHETAFAHAFDSKFGNGTYQVAKQIADKDSGGNQSIANVSFDRTAQMFQGKMNNLTKRGGMNEDQARESISGMAQSTLSQVSESGGNIKSILAQESSKLNSDVGITSTPALSDTKIESGDTE